jgi:hypothetical protein
MIFDRPLSGRFAPARSTRRAMYSVSIATPTVSVDGQANGCMGRSRGYAGSPEDDGVLLGTDQTAPGGLFTSTDFDKTISKLKTYIGKASKPGTLQDALTANAERFMLGYRDFALKKNAGYNQSELEVWRSALANYGLPTETILPLLSYYRRMHDAGLVPDSVYNPAAWLQANPEAKADPRSWYQQLIDMVGNKIGTVAMWGGIGLAAYFILPKLLVSGMRGLRK